MNRYGTLLRAALVAGVHDATGLHQHQVGFFLRARLVLHALGDDCHVARPQVDVAVAQFDPEPAADDDERFVGVRMAVPDEIALHLDHLELVVVHLGDDLGLPVLGE